jgi:hypothetical protein
MRENDPLYETIGRAACRYTTCPYNSPFLIHTSPLFTGVVVLAFDNLHVLWTQVMRVNDVYVCVVNNVIRDLKLHSRK